MIPDGYQSLPLSGRSLTQGVRYSICSDGVETFCPYDWSTSSLHTNPEINSAKKLRHASLMLQPSLLLQASYNHQLWICTQSDLLESYIRRNKTHLHDLL